MPLRIRRDRALPLDLLADDTVYALERRDIWARDWLFAAPADAVAEPGDYLAVTIGDQPVLLVRGRDLSVRALRNTCSHRGMPLADGSGTANRIACPYHGWTYADDGELQSVPYTLPDELERAALGLDEYRCETWHGLVFVSFDDDIEPLADTLGVIDAYVRPLAIARLHHGQTIRSEVWHANWKAIHANAIDSYSGFRVHADTIEPTSPTDAAYYLAGSAAATVTGGESYERADHLVIAVPPSFVAVVHSDVLVWQSWTPLAVDRTLVRTGMAAETAEAASEQPVSFGGWSADHLDEDRQICERLQRAARSGGEVGPLTSNERPQGDFHDYLRSRLTGAAPAPSFIAAAPGERPTDG